MYYLIVLILFFYSSIISACDKNISFAYRSKYIVDSGDIYLDNPIYDITLDFKCGYIGLIGWGALNTESKNINEIDAGVYLDFSYKNFDLKFIIGRLSYLEDKSKNDAMMINMNYSDYVDINLNYLKFLDEEIHKYYFDISKKIELTRFASYSLNIVPKVKIVFVNEVHLNTLYSLSLNVDNEELVIGPKISFHDNYSKSIVFELNLSYFF